MVICPVEVWAARNTDIPTHGKKPPIRAIFLQSMAFPFPDPIEIQRRHQPRLRPGQIPAPLCLQVSGRNLKALRKPRANPSKRFFNSDLFSDLKIPLGKPLGAGRKCGSKILNPNPSLGQIQKLEIRRPGALHKRQAASSQTDSVPVILRARQAGLTEDPLHGKQAHPLFRQLQSRGKVPYLGSSLVRGCAKSSIPSQKGETSRGRRAEVAACFRLQMQRRYSR